MLILVVRTVTKVIDKQLQLLIPFSFDVSMGATNIIIQTPSVCALSLFYRYNLIKSTRFHLISLSVIKNRNLHINGNSNIALSSNSL